MTPIGTAAAIATESTSTKLHSMSVYDMGGRGMRTRHTNHHISSSSNMNSLPSYLVTPPSSVRSSVVTCDAVTTGSGQSIASRNEDAERTAARAHPRVVPSV